MENWKNRKKCFLLAVALVVVAIQSSCVSVPALNDGLQPRANALRLGRILAVPPMIFPHPKQKTSIDKATLESTPFLKELEGTVLKAFQNQPQVNGVSFSAVRKQLGENNELLELLTKSLNQTSQILNVGSENERRSFSVACLQAKSMLEFYEFCMVPQSKWRQKLNQLSAKVFLADAALLVMVQKLEKQKTIQEKESYKSSLQLSLILVDTNSGEMLWGREKSMAANADVQFPTMSSLSEDILTGDFWAQFPGRVVR